MKIAILGVGAIGGHLAVRLARAGNAVSAIARGETLQAIRTTGLRLEADGTTHDATIHAAESAAELGPQDVVFVTVKATAVASIVGALRPLVGPATRVVFAQNGIGWWYPVALPAGHPDVPALPQFGLADVFLEFLRPQQIVAGVVYSANEVLAPGLVRNNSVGRNVLEIASLVDADDEAVAQLRACLAAAHVDSPAVADIRASSWQKLVGNASSSPISVATGNPSSINTDADIRRTFERLVADMLATARAYGFELADRFDLDRWTKNRSRHKPSMLQDFEHGRPMEIDEIVLAPVRFARHAGIRTPTLDAITAVVVQLARSRGLYPG
jgi:2-dehydropantoate 2-reductase